MESPLDPHDDAATYRVACQACNEAVWAAHSPPPAEGEDLLADHECPGPLEAQIEPGSNGNDGVTMGEPDYPAEVGASESIVEPVSFDGAPGPWTPPSAVVH